MGPALLKDGRELVDMILYGELLGQATGVSNDKIPLSNFPQPTLNLLSRFAPFSLLAFYGLWCVFRRPEQDLLQRRFERFLACSIIGGLLVFSIAAHFRSDLILPLWAPAALLAGREASRLAERIGRGRFAWSLAASTVLLFGFAWWTYHPKHGPRARVVTLSENVRNAADALKKTGIDPRRMLHVETPSTLQMYLETAHQWTSPAALVETLNKAEGASPAWIAIGPSAKIDAGLPEGFSAIEVFRWPGDAKNTPVVRVFEIVAKSTSDGPFTPRVPTHAVNWSETHGRSPKTTAVLPPRDQPWSHLSSRSTP
jgi:predicted nucleic acid-binding protein